MSNIVEVAAQIDINYARLILNNCLGYPVYRFMSCPIGSISKRSRLEVRLKDRLQYELERPLHHSAPTTTVWLRTRDRYHRRNGRVAANHRSGFAATASISRSRSRSSPSACLNAPGGRSNGVRGALNPCRRDSLAFVFALPIRIISSRSLAPKSGC